VLLYCLWNISFWQLHWFKGTSTSQTHAYALAKEYFFEVDKLDSPYTLLLKLGRSLFVSFPLPQAYYFSPSSAEIQCVVKMCAVKDPVFILAILQGKFCTIPFCKVLLTVSRLCVITNKTRRAWKDDKSNHHSAYCASKKLAHWQNIKVLIARIYTNWSKPKASIRFHV